MTGETLPDALADLLTRMALACEDDEVVVITHDPETGQYGAHGPYGGPRALVEAQRLRETFDQDGLPDVMVTIGYWAGR
jgi:hypothetical protein